MNKIALLIVMITIINCEAWYKPEIDEPQYRTNRITNFNEPPINYNQDIQIVFIIFAMIGYLIYTNFFC